MEHTHKHPHTIYRRELLCGIPMAAAFSVSVEFRISRLPEYGITRAIYITISGD